MSDIDSRTIGGQGEGPVAGDPTASPQDERRNLGIGQSRAAMTPGGGVSSPRPVTTPYQEPRSPYQEPSRITEEDLLRAAIPTQAVVKPCACGTDVVCDPQDIPLGVRAHNALPEHQAWRRREGIE